MTALVQIDRFDAMFSAGEVPREGMLARLVLFYRWCCGGGAWIRDVDAKLVPMVLNEAQLRLLALMMCQAAQRKPIRVIVMKARKTGISTFIECLCSHLCALYENQQAVMIGHRDDDTKTIFEIAGLCAKSLEGVEQEPDIGLMQIRFPKSNSSFRCHSAGGVAVGAGGTPNLLHLSEVAKWDRNKASTEYNATISVPMTETSIIVYESTAKGRELFYKRFISSYDPDSMYVPLFVAWYVDDRYRLPAMDGFRRTDDERLLADHARELDRIDLTNAQLQWRRTRIVELGEDVFRQEFPSTPEEAVQASRGLIYAGARRHVVESLPFDEGLVPWSHRIGGIDFGYHDPTVIWSGYYVDQVIWLTGFYRAEQALAADHVEGLIEGATYWCDPAAKSDRKELARACGVFGRSANLQQAPRRKYPGDDVASFELKLLIRWLGQNRIRFMRGVSDQVMVELDNFAWNENTGKPDESRQMDCGHWDSIMALKYLVMGVERGLFQIGGSVSRETGDRGRGRRSQFAGV